METPQHIKDEALEKFCSPHGKANPETYAYIAGRLASKKEIEELGTKLIKAMQEVNDLGEENRKLKEELFYLTSAQPLTPSPVNNKK